MLIICRTWTVVHILHATEMVAETRGWRRSGSLKAGVSAVIKRLSWWFWRRFYEERWPESFTGRRGRLLQKWERGRDGGCFRCGGGRLVVGLATCVELVVALVGGWNGREREGEKKNCINRAEMLVFGRLWTWNPPPFIGSGRGQFCLHRGKISSPWFDWKYPNHWFKVCTLNCQIWQSKAARVGYFRPVTGAFLMFIGLNERY